MADNEIKPQSDVQVASTEPGITLKVTDAVDHEVVLAAIQEAVKEEESVSQETGADANLDISPPSEFNPLSKSSPSELFQALDRLPTLWTVQLLLLMPMPKVFMMFGVWVYWLFSTFTTSKAVVALTGTKNVRPFRILLAGLSQGFCVAGMAILVVLMVILSENPLAMQRIEPVYMFMLGGFACSFVYNLKWSFSTNRAISKFEREHSKTPYSWWKSLLVDCSISVLLNSVFMYFASLVSAILWSTGVFNGLVQFGFVVSLLAFQFMGFYILNHRLRKAALLRPDYKNYLRLQGKEKNVFTDAMVVRYRAFAEWERWFKHRFSQRSHKKLIYMVVMIVIFFAAGAPQWCLSWLVGLVGMTPQAVAGAGGAAGGAVAINFLNIFQSFLVTILSIFGLVYVSKPTHLGFSEKGIRFLWRHRIFSRDGKYVSWQILNRIGLVMPRGKTSPSDQSLIFHTDSNSDLTVKLACVLEVDGKERILKAIERWAPDVERDASVLQILQAPADHSYTELWLQALTAPPKRERFKPLAEGATLNNARFQIKGQLGVGGQGTAYLAQDTLNEGSVVLKEFILPVYVDVAVRRQALERFENEARILQKLECDQIVKLVDFFVEDHRSYLVLEHIEGKSLKQIVDADGPLSEDRARALAEQMCNILKYLHGLSPPVVHRDFTPDNLILRHDGTLKLVDFNVAQQTDSTATGTVVGKHAYLPPEQFRGTPTPQSDLYAMGATLFFLLTGSDPEPISVSRPNRVNDSVSDSMDLLVSTATAMTLEQRYQDVGELENDLNRLFQAPDAEKESEKALQLEVEKLEDR